MSSSNSTSVATKPSNELIEGIAVNEAKSSFQPFSYKPLPLSSNQVEVAVHACGVCHSDLHLVNNDWGMSHYPLVPGHEIIGTVTAIGSDVTEVKLGQRVGVALQVSSCNECEQCGVGDTQLCKKPSWVFSWPTGVEAQPYTYGGFAGYVRVNEHWAFPIPDTLSSIKAAPLMCAGITVWSPFIHYKLGPKHRVGIIGVGGLGHLAVQFAVKFGCHTTGISTSSDKEAEVKRYGAQAFLNINDSKSVSAAAGKFDFLISTISADGINWDQYLDLLAPNGVLSLLGASSKVTFSPIKILQGRLSITGSPLASNKEVREMLEFCAKHNIVAATEERDLTPEGANDALTKVRNNTARYRMVLVNRNIIPSH